ncbi:hypothetical protein FQZ97_1248550 [compost metagenome]
MMASTTSLKNQPGTKPMPAAKAALKRSKDSSDDTEVSNSQTISGKRMNIRPPLARCRIDTHPARGRR